METVTIQHKGEVQTVPATMWQATLDDMVTRLGAWVVGESKVERNGVNTLDRDPMRPLAGTGCSACGNAPCEGHAGPMLPTPENPATPKANSSFGGELVKDEQARERIEATHAALREQGVDVDAGRQLYATGTRMADVGYSTQRERAREHERKQPARDAVAAFVATIEAEQRHEREVSARDIAAGLTINGALAFDGFKLREQAIRGLLARCGSPATGYVFGLRNRIVEAKTTLKRGTIIEGPDSKPTERTLTASERDDLSSRVESDKAELLDCMRYELAHVGRGTAIVLRMRDGLGDIFAAVSPGYGIADAPSVMPDLLRALPADAKASFSYDPASTSWELRANVWTPTPVDEQAVGEPFEAYSSITGKDNGTGGLDGGGGVMLLACLNASTYVADGVSVRRIHRKNVLVNIRDMIAASTRAVGVLCQAWGKARAATLAQPVADDGKLIPLELAVPGFFRHMLTARRGELVGVLPGRTEKHVKALALAYDGERRDAVNVTRADLAQGFTRYIQEQPTIVRRDAERAIGAWLAKGERVEYAAA